MQKLQNCIGLMIPNFLQYESLILVQTVGAGQDSSDLAISIMGTLKNGNVSLTLSSKAGVAVVTCKK